MDDEAHGSIPFIGGDHTPWRAKRAKNPDAIAVMPLTTNTSEITPSQARTEG
ncbi:hypothetical protein [Planotetraspora mira]|uniref:hypothetical protein n=1 Tax=Planotetraspora mira TaxID=58121 RepID=UPI001952873E|nr:hypothetical protein [Planotetraspora mira]